MSQSAGDKTEKATPKKRKDARKRGQVVKSTEVTTAFCSIVMFALLSMLWVSITDKLMKLYTDFLSTGVLETANTGITISDVQGLYSKVLMSLAGIMLPILGVAFLAGLLANILQIGFLFTTDPLKPKLERISPLKGFKRIFSVRTVIELLKSLLKLILLGYILYSEYSKLLDSFASYMGVNLYLAFIEIMRTAFSVALKMSLVLAIIAAFDYFFQWRKNEKDLMMTKQEVKDEYKLTEGDPQIKGRIRQKQRQMSAMRMMDRVPSADVVITNPTHFAVALKYEAGVSGAPVVVAKGQDYIARKIKEVAIENGIEIVENKPLAQALYNLCDIDSEIPEEFYQAVADILVYVYRQKNQRAAVRA